MAGSNTHYAKAILGMNSKDFKRGVKSANRAWTGFSSGLLRSIGPMAAALGGAGLARAIIQTGAAFEQQMANIKAVTRSSTEEMLTMEAAARQLGATTSFSASEVADGMTILAKATGSATKAVAGIESVLKLAGSEGAAMNDTAELMISSMNAFGIEFDESARVANVFASAAQNSRMSVERLKDSMKGVSAMARELGLGLEETVAATSILVDSGLEAASAGVLLRSAFADIVKAGGEMGKALEGVSLRSDGVSGVLRALSAAGIEGEEVFKQFNIRGASTVAILQRQMEKFEDLRDKITGSTAAWDAYATQQDTTTMAWERVKSAMSEVSVAIFQTFGTDLKGALDDAALWILASRDAIATFAADTAAFMKKAAFEVQQYGSRFAELFTAMEAGLAAADLGEAIEKALVPQISPKWKLMLALVGGDVKRGSEAWADILGNGGENAAEAFASAFMESFGPAAGEIAAAREEFYAQVERERQEHLDRLKTIHVADDGTAQTIATDITLGLKEADFSGAWSGLESEAITAGAGFAAAFDRSTAGMKARADASADDLEDAHVNASFAAARLWDNAFAHITDVHITGSERWKGIIGGSMDVISRMLSRMIAEAIATKLELERIFAGMGVPGLGVLGIGIGLLGNLFHDGGFVNGPSGGEQVALLKNREFVIPPGPTARFRPMLEEMRAGRMPQLAAAGGGGVNIEAHVHVPSGSILYAQNPMGIRELAEQFNREIEKTVRRAYRE